MYYNSITIQFVYSQSIYSYKTKLGHEHDEFFVFTFKFSCQCFYKKNVKRLLTLFSSMASKIEKRLISAEIEPVVNHTEKLCTAIFHNY